MVLSHVEFVGWGRRSVGKRPGLGFVRLSLRLTRLEDTELKATASCPSASDENKTDTAGEGTCQGFCRKLDQGSSTPVRLDRTDAIIKLGISRYTVQN